MKKFLNRIFGIFIRAKGIAKADFTTIEEEVRALITDATTEIDIRAKIFALLAHYKPSEFDVYDFQDTLQKVAKTIPQEKMRYSATKTIMENIGVTMDDVTQSIIYYSGVFSNFLKSAKDHADSLVSTSEKDVEEKIKAFIKQREENKKQMEILLHNNSDIEDTISKITNTQKKYSDDVKRVKELVVHIVTNSIAALKNEKEKCIKHLS